MIVAMKKVAVIMQPKDSVQALKVLRSFGAVHVENQQLPKSVNLNSLQDDYALVQQGLEVFSEEEFIEHCQGDLRHKETPDWKITCRHTIDLWKRIDHLESYSFILSQQIKEWEKWGDFDPQAIDSLIKRNIYCGLYKIPVKDLADLSGDYVIKKIYLEDGIAYCAVVARVKPEFSFKEIELPKMSLSVMKNKLSENKLIIDRLRQELHQQLCFRGAFEKAKVQIEKEIEFENALSGMAQETKLSYLVGFFPAAFEKQLTVVAKKEKWGIFITDPSEEDNVPVLIRHPKWISLIDPIYKLMEVLPGYRELDVSPVFLLFLALFFGMIIGDAGYGIVYFLLTFLAQLKLKSRVRKKTVFFLFYLFSGCAIIWGLLTGTFFGQQWYLAKGFKALAPVLNDAKFLMTLCFLLGAVQLSLAHVLQALKKLPSLMALADFGFICLLWAGFFLAKMFILGDPFPKAGGWLIGIGAALIIFFVSPQKNLFKTIGTGLGTLALGAMGNFGDVVSYIRLFAVGLAGVAVSDSVNLLAANAGGNIIAQAGILFVGHSINITLGPISVLVHGIRLNVLEFSVLHGNVTWSGKAFNPLKE